VHVTRNKDLKRLVRTRMRKTGESYTAARASVITRSSTEPTLDYSALSGMADATIHAKTGRTWKQWVAILDRADAATMSHGKIAALVASTYNVDGWWAQSVTVGYERIKGLRVVGQRRDGSYEANKSRTFRVPVDALFEAWANARVRKRWLDGKVGKVRTATAPKSMRLDGEDRSIVVVLFTAKGASKSVVAVQHTKVRDREMADRLKQYWSDRLDALAEVLGQ
jgi:hypothetical protein